MINVDTNILVRAFMGDHPTQSPIAQAQMTVLVDNKRLFISSYAILEMVWVLKGKKYTRQEIADAVSLLLNTKGTIIGQRHVVQCALEYYQHGKADFGDYMIMAEGQQQGAQAMATFDQALITDSSHAFAPKMTSHQHI